MNYSKLDTKVKKRNISMILLLLILVAAVFFIVVFKTDTFSVKSIIVEGNEALIEEEIIMGCGNIYSNNIFKIKLSEIKINLLENPYIKTASIKRKLPDKILIQVTERKEEAVIPYMGSYLYIDREGVVLKSDSIPVGMNIVSGLEFTNFMEGEILQVSDQEQLVIALDIAIKLDEMNIPIKEIDVSNKESIIIRLSERLYSKIGNEKDLEYKLKVLNEIMKDLQARDITRGVIDISHEGYPSYRPVE